VYTGVDISVVVHIVHVVPNTNRSLSFNQNRIRGVRSCIKGVRARESGEQRELFRKIDPVTGYGQGNYLAGTFPQILA
jgi:hypothetical protein